VTARLDKVRFLIGMALVHAAGFVMPPARGPFCPDCGISPAGAGPCETCDALDGMRQREARMYDTGFMDGAATREEAGL
jgi:hypothetical protein